MCEWGLLNSLSDSFNAFFTTFEKPLQLWLHLLFMLQSSTDGINASSSPRSIELPRRPQCFFFGGSDVGGLDDSVLKTMTGEGGELVSELDTEMSSPFSVRIRRSGASPAAVLCGNDSILHFSSKEGCVTKAIQFRSFFCAHFWMMSKTISSPSSRNFHRIFHSLRNSDRNCHFPGNKCVDQQLHQVLSTKTSFCEHHGS